MNTTFISGPNRPGARCGTKTSDSIELELTKPAGGITEYRIVCNDPGCPDDYVPVPTNRQTHNFEGLDPYTEYTFKVTAVKTYTLYQSIQKTKSGSELLVSCRTNQKGKGIFHFSHCHPSPFPPPCMFFFPVSSFCPSPS